MSFISMRRSYLDQSLEKYRQSFYGRVLDIGGKKEQRRGSFVPPYDQVEQWVHLNNDPHTQPDVLATIPPLPFEDCSFDVILITETIEYIDDATLLLSEIQRVLKPSGTLLMSSPFLSPFHNDHDSDYHRYTESFLKQLLQNFANVECERQGGAIAVSFDLFRAYFAYSRDGQQSTCSRYSLKVLCKMAPLFFWLDQRLFKQRFHINTGFFIKGTKVAA